MLREVDWTDPPTRIGHGPVGPARGRAFVGCSGWSYDDWRGPVYSPEMPRRLWFEAYASMFDTVEFNSTFYRLPTAETARAWGAQAPEGFVYAVKLGQFCSHRKKLLDAATWLPNHVDRVERLVAALGPTLVQLPPRWHRDVDRLEEFLAVAPRSMRWAVELRDPSWLHDDVFELLHRYDAALSSTTCWRATRGCGRPDGRTSATTGLGLPQSSNGGLHGARRLAPGAVAMSGWLNHGCDVYAYFNNDYDGHAVQDARWLARRLNPDGPSVFGKAENG